MHISTIYQLISLLITCTLRFNYGLDSNLSGSYTKIFDTSRKVGLQHYIVTTNNSVTGFQARHFIPVRARNRFAFSCEVVLFANSSRVFPKTYENLPADKHHRVLVPLLKIYFLSISKCFQVSLSRTKYCFSLAKVWKPSYITNYKFISVPLLIMEEFTYIASSTFVAKLSTVRTIPVRKLDISKYEIFADLTIKYRDTFSNERQKYEPFNQKKVFRSSIELSVKDEYVQCIHRILRLHNITFSTVEQHSSYNSGQDIPAKSVVLPFDVYFSGFKYLSFFDGEFLKTRHKTYTSIKMFSLVVPLGPEVWAALIVCFAIMVAVIYSVHSRFEPLTIFSALIEQAAPSLTYPRGLTITNGLVCLWFLNMFLIRQFYLSDMYTELSKCCPTT